MKLAWLFMVCVLLLNCGRRRDTWSTVTVIGSDGKPCKMAFRQGIEGWAALLNSTDCPVTLNGPRMKDNLR